MKKDKMKAGSFKMLMSLKFTITSFKESRVEARCNSFLKVR